MNFICEVYLHKFIERKKGGKEERKEVGAWERILTFHRYTSKQRKLPQIRGPSFKTGSQDTSKTQRY